MRDAIREDFATLPQGGAHVPFLSTFSAGLVSPETDISVDALIEAADRALYQAKRGGRNRIAQGTP